MLTGSSVNENENLIKSTSAVSTSVSKATGEIPVMDRRSLQCQLNADLTPAVTAMLDTWMFAWRRANLYLKAHEVTVVLASGEGYTTSKAYIDAINVVSPDDGGCSVGFDITAWDWTDLTGTELARVNSAFNPFNDINQTIIPHWDTCANTGGIGNTLSFGFGVSHNYGYHQLCQAVGSAPEPALILAGPLAVTFAAVTPAKRGIRPPNRIDGAQIKLGGVVDTARPQRVLTIPTLYRDPGRNPTGVGEQNTLIRWNAGWAALQDVPEMV